MGHLRIRYHDPAGRPSLKTGKSAAERKYRGQNIIKMPAWDEPSHPMRPCASLSMKSPLGIVGRISKRKHRKTPAGRISFPLPRALLYLSFFGGISVFFGADPFCGLFLCRAAGTGIFIRGSSASAFASPDGIPSFGLLSAHSEGPMDRRGLFLFSAFPLFLLCFSALPLSVLPLFAFRLFVSGCADPERMGANGREWDVGKGVNGRFLSAGHRPFLTSSVILLPYARRICRFRYNRRRSRCSVPRRTWCSGNF